MDSITITMPGSYQPERTYVCDVIFGEFLGIDYNIEFVSKISNKYIFGYNDQSISFPDVLFSTEPKNWLKKSSFPSSPLRQVSVGDRFFSPTVPVLVGAENPQQPVTIADIDFLGSIFFMLTRYEEINAEAKDSFGRFHHRVSIFHKAGVLRRPLVNEYLEILKEEIKKIAPRVGFKKHSYSLSLSHDVDVPITFHYPFTDYIKKSFGDLYFRKSPELMLRRFKGKLKYARNKTFESDPNNNFDYLMQTEEKGGIRSVFNFIPVQGNSPLDSHYDIDHPFITGLLKGISERGFEIGFHPSFDSFQNMERTKKELEHLNKTLAKIGIPGAVKGRQHYLRWTNPHTWQIWDEIGLKEDSSVGYGMINGFRSGCAYKYSVFDLKNRRHLSLIEEPLILMDVNCNINTEHETILNEVSYFSNVCRYFQGNFTLLYHNNYVISKSQQNIFEEILKIAG